MTKSASLAELQRAGVTVEPEEAVAIVQQLIAALRDGGQPEPLEPPFGPPTPETVVLHSDGTVTCRGCDATPAVSEIARLLDAMLQAGVSRPAGALRYTIARARLDVDAPPFDSIEHLSRALARFESGPRERAVTRALRRREARSALAPAPVADRRRQPQATLLRRALREADARLYLQTVAPPTIVVATQPEPRPRSYSAPAACIAAGLLLVGIGEVMHGWRAVAAPAPLPPLAAPALYVPRPLEISPATAAPVALADSAPPHTPAVRRAAPRAKHAAQVSRVRNDRARGRTAAPRGKLDFLRFRWLRTVFARTDL